ncbi:MAG: hypothetical protein KIT84_15195 [Labilithrix sp.]|nr:hypothetical protein [Labilithrix sp.]MCW5812370.1 hypothetical protein [Labilithrix sp.]
MGILARASLLLLLGAAACSPASEDAAASTGDLTSLTARSRKLEFAGYVYVEDGMSDVQILLTVKQQTQSAFGALQAANVGVKSRELANVDPATFLKVPVEVVDKNAPEGSVPRHMIRVAYTYSDEAIVPVTLADRSALSLALLGTNYQSQSAKILPECTKNDTLAHEFQNSVWYVFDPQVASCAPAMADEQKKIDADRAGLDETQIPASELTRLYIPTTVKLSPTDEAQATKYPEYDLLYSGMGVESGKLVIGMVNGLMADWAAGETHELYEDAGYPMWFGGMREVFIARPGFELVKVEGVEKPLDYEVAGVPIHFNTWKDLMAFELDKVNPPGMGGLARDEVRKVIADTLSLKWVVFEAPVTVRMNGESYPLTIKLQTYFGSDTDQTPHKRAIKTSDIMVYNGHSYIGYGPLDPSRFTPEDFPGSYQVLHINGCVSYNYYNKDYVPLKVGGTKSLDIVTNGLQSWVTESGQATGRYVGAFIDGHMNSYKDILVKSQFTYYGYEWGMDALRVVDGELDNTYDPATKPIAIANGHPAPEPPPVTEPPPVNQQVAH